MISLSLVSSVFYCQFIVLLLDAFWNMLVMQSSLGKLLNNSRSLNIVGVGS